MTTAAAAAAAAASAILQLSADVGRRRRRHAQRTDERKGTIMTTKPNMIRARFLCQRRRRMMERSRASN
jgi:hypothetical protein